MATATKKKTAPPKHPTCKQLMTQLKKLGKESHRKTYIKHGAPPGGIYGVPVADLKPIFKKIKKDYKLALELYDTGNSDAMYLAGLIADESKMTKANLNKWARDATWYMISDFAVAWVTSESPHAIELALKWIDSKQEKIAATGWATLSSYTAITPDDEIDIKLFQSLLDRVVKEIKGERNNVKSNMNGFVIAVGSWVVPLHKKAISAGKKIGKVDVDHGETSCKTPDIVEYIGKVAKRGSIGRKRKTARC